MSLQRWVGCPSTEPRSHRVRATEIRELLARNPLTKEGVRASEDACDYRVRPLYSGALLRPEQGVRCSLGSGETVGCAGEGNANRRG